MNELDLIGEENRRKADLERIKLLKSKGQLNGGK